MLLSLKKNASFALFVFCLLGTFSPVFAFLQGDFDRNGTVNADDLAILARSWMSTITCENNHECPDIDGNHRVDWHDFAVLSSNWLKTDAPKLVISEFMADNNHVLATSVAGRTVYPDWIEIYNPTPEEVNLKGWFLTDDPGDLTRWSLPEVILSPGEYFLVFASGKNRDDYPDNFPYIDEKGYYHTNFSLDRGKDGIGEYLALIAADGQTIVHEYSPYYPEQYPDWSYGWSKNMSGKGYFTEPTPQADNGQPVQDPTHRIIINEIMYHPFNSAHPTRENPLEEYIELYNRSQEEVDVSGWQLVNGVQLTIPEGVTIPGRGYLVLAADKAVFLEKYPGVDADKVIGGWTGKLSNRGEKIELVNAAGSIADQVEYADQGEWAQRELGPVDFGHRGWVWSNEHDGLGKSLELVQPGLPNEYGQNWTASLVEQGTPGAVNSTVQNNLAPMILDVKQTPIIPHSEDDVVITATIKDELVNGLSVSLHYRKDGAADFTSIIMTDDGQSGDKQALDGIYTAVIPADVASRPDGTIVEFYIEAGDGQKMRTWPAAVIVDGQKQQAANAMYQIEDGFDSTSWNVSDKPIYYLIMLEKYRAELEDIGDDGNPFSGEGASNAQMNATFISWNGRAVEVRYNVGVRNRGNRSRVDPPMNYRINFRSDEPWHDITALNLNTKYPHLQLMGSILHAMSGLAASEVSIVRVRVNGENLAASDYNRTYNYYAALEAYDSDWAANHFPDDKQGNLYRCTYYTDGVHPRTYADLVPKTDPAEPQNPDDYRQNYPKRTNVAEDDYSDLFSLIISLNDNSLSDEEFLAEVKKVANIEQWMRFLAVDAILGNREGGLTTGTGDDYAIYRGVKDPRFVLVAHDLDTILGQGDHSADPQRDIFVYAGVRGLRRLFQQPEVINMYYRQYQDLLETVFTPEKVDPLFDELLGGWVPQSAIDSMKVFLQQRAKSILYGGYPNAGDSGQIPVGPLSGEASLTMVGGYYHTNDASATIQGKANAITSRAIQVNGTVANWDQKSGQWDMDGALDLNPGINRLYIDAYGDIGYVDEPVESSYVDIWYDTGSSNDYPKDAASGSSGISNQGDTGQLTLRLLTRDSYLPGIPVLVRVEVVDENGRVDRRLWDGSASIAVDNPAVTADVSEIVLRNGLGSALVTFTGGGDFTLTAEAVGLQTQKHLTDWQGQNMVDVAGTLSGSSTSWSGIIHVTGDLLVPAGHILTIQPGTLVLLDGVASGTNGTDIVVQGTLESLGTEQSPVTFTASNSQEAWGEIYHNGSEPSDYAYTIITRAGNAPGGGHTGTGPAIRSVGSRITLDFCTISDLQGKIMQASSSDLVFRHCHLARAIMGPEIDGTALLFENNFITEMFGPDDDDGIYVHSQQAGQDVILRGGVIAAGDDDALDTLHSTVVVEDYIFRNFADKGVSVFGGSVTLNHVMSIDNNVGVSAKDQSHALVIIDHATISGNAIGLQARQKESNMAGALIEYHVSNSIVWGNGTAIQTDYNLSDFQINYSLVGDRWIKTDLTVDPPVDSVTSGQTWPGTGMLNEDPMFVNAVEHDFQLQGDSPAIDSGDPAYEKDADQTITDMGYYHYSGSGQNPPAGSLAENTIWKAKDGPYRITGELTIPAGITLTIEPGVTIFFEPGTRMIIKGRLNAVGRKYEPIRFTRLPGGGGSWGGLQFRDTASESHIDYAIIEYGRSNDGMIGLEKGMLLLENCTLDHTDLRRIRTIDSSLTVRDCVFTDIFGLDEPPSTDNFSEHIWGHGVPEDGHFIIEGNYFGKTKGHNDAIDFDGPRRPRRIPEFYDNVFAGGGDDALDLLADAYIEGNIFMNFNKDEYNHSSGESNVISAGGGMHYVMVRNIMYNIQHVAQVKDDSYLTFVNNTVVDCKQAAIYLDLGLPGRNPGRGAYVDGCIFDRCPEDFAGITADRIFQVNHSLVNQEWVGFGVGNLVGEGLLVDPGQGDFLLADNSPARGTGPNGTDMGAMVSGGVSISHLPNDTTYDNEVTFSIAGPGITHYKYRLDPCEPWSEKQALPLDPCEATAELTLAELEEGSHHIELIGENFAGVWQDETEPTRYSWTVDSNYSRLIINEVLARNASIAYKGQFSNMIELYYDGPAGNQLDLAGMSISDDRYVPRKYVFPEGTTLVAGEYLVLLADKNYATEGLHTGFALDGEGEGVYLYDREGKLLDEVEFGLQVVDMSIGRVGTDGHWALTVPSFGTANIMQPLGDTSGLTINEWLASGQVLFDSDFVELYNPAVYPVCLAGIYLTDDPMARPGRYEFGELNFIGAGGFAYLQADGSAKPGHLNFKLKADHEYIGLYDSQLREIDKVVYFSQKADVSQGRVPNGGDSFNWFDLPTPGMSNPYTWTETTTYTLVAEDAAKKAIVPTAAGQVGADWNSAVDFDTTQWLGGTGGVGYERSPGSSTSYANLIGINVENDMYHHNTTCYIRIPFTIDNIALEGVTRLVLKVRFDDGFIAYLNGREVARSHASGTLGWNGHASSNHDDHAALQWQEFDISSYLGELRAGENLLAIHGLNVSSSSSDFLISAELVAEATINHSDDSLEQAKKVLNSLRITEIMYHPPEGSDYEFIELENVGAETINLEGVRFSKGIQFVFPAMELAAGEYVVLVNNRAVFESHYDSSNVLVAGEYTGNLNNGGEELVLQLAEPLEAAVLRFSYDDNWYPGTDGQGYSLVIRNPAAEAASWNDKDSWQQGSVLGGSPGSE